ncbi:hypothetical protein RRF57_013340 [Xylaria bambusicola]|uniref:Uncharacterized protein n=1 Tax=Xylaria bambusicola TaxID=326684 RepID=A0AAN7Z585_9PEZI
MTANANTQAERTARTTVMSSQTKFSLVYFSPIAGAAFTVSGVLTTLSVPRDPKRSSPFSAGSTPMSAGSKREHINFIGFVLAAQLAKLNGLANAFNFFLVFTGLTCAPNQSLCRFEGVIWASPRNCAKARIGF